MRQCCKVMVNNSLIQPAAHARGEPRPRGRRLCSSPSPAPAFAGVNSGGRSTNRKPLRDYWMPAFAGMTGEERSPRARLPSSPAPAFAGVNSGGRSSNRKPLRDYWMPRFRGASQGTGHAMGQRQPTCDSPANCGGVPARLMRRAPAMRYRGWTSAFGGATSSQTGGSGDDLTHRKHQSGLGSARP
jgi:hypothetical protein